MDLTTDYLGLKLKNPLVAGASPLSREVDGIRALADQGIAAVVLYSLFQEQIEHEIGEYEHFQAAGTEASAEALSYLPALDYFPRGPEEYLTHIGKVKDAVNIPVIASLNGSTLGGWTDWAALLEKAGADALELNVYHLATDPALDALAVENGYVEIVKAVKSQVKIPVAVKLSPFFSSLPHFARRLDEAGVDGLVLFNRFYQPDIDLDSLEIVPDLALSSAHEMRLPLRWIAVLDPLVKASLAATTAVYSADSVLKFLLAGADVTMLCAGLLKQGPGLVRTILEGLSDWLTHHEYESVRQLQGSMNHRNCSNPGALERANYMQALQTYA